MVSMGFEGPRKCCQLTFDTFICSYRYFMWLINVIPTRSLDSWLQRIPGNSDASSAHFSKKAEDGNLHWHPRHYQSVKINGGASRESQTISKNLKLAPRISNYLQISPNISKYLKESPNISKYLKESPRISNDLEGSGRIWGNGRSGGRKNREEGQKHPGESGEISGKIVDEKQELTRKKNAARCSGT